jgi:predicted transcriptional regulator of viral defense system
LTATMTSVLLRADLLAHGFTDNDIRRARVLGVLTAVSPGVYLRAAAARELDLVDRHRIAAEALLRRLGGHPVICHVSAAILHRLPVQVTEPAVVHVTTAGASKSRNRPGLRVHAGALTTQEVVIVDGLAMTSVPRTLLDCALVLPAEQALRLADAALRRALVTTDELAAQLGRRRRVPGVRAAAQLIASACTDVTRRP